MTVDQQMAHLAEGTCLCHLTPPWLLMSVSRTGETTGG